MADLQYYADKVIDEIDDACDYIKHAIELKAMTVEFSKHFLDMAQQELMHAEKFKTMFCELYETTKKANDCEAGYMQEMYVEVMHYWLEEYPKVKVLIDMYKK